MARRISTDDREKLRAVERLFHAHWAPIPGCPADEFDTYAGQVFGILRRGGSAEDAAAYLGEAAETMLGLSPSPAHDLEIARRAWAIVNVPPMEPRDAGDGLA